MASLTWHGHATCSIRLDDGTTLVIDPFFDDNPKADISAADVEADWILLTHGHGDHIADAAPIARRTGATVICSVELSEHMAAQGVEKIHAMNIGGGYDFPFGRVKMVNAIHGGRVEGAAAPATTTSPCAGYLIRADGIRLYHAGDTALTMDMRLLEGQVDVALLPIGDNFTMGPDDAARAVGMIRPRLVVPIHYNTWPIIEVDPQRFVDEVGDTSRVRVMEPGGTLDLA